MRLLFIASDRMEYSGLLARSRDVRAAGIGLDWARRGQLGEHDTLLVANGAGWTRAAAALDATLDWRPHVIVSTGFCGALDEQLKLGDVVIGTGVLTADGCSFATARVSGKAAASGVFYSSRSVVGTAEEKRLLRQTGACAVEMEAAGIAQKAETLGIPVICVRAVTDLADEEMANDFNAALRSDGHFDTMLILRGLKHHPALKLRELVRLRNRCVRAARSLGDFFADCRFCCE
jgi:adenosylhomocysteine nucleosidase